MIAGLYRAATTLGGPLVDRLLDARMRRGKEDAARIGERRGVAGLPRPEGTVVWVHAASVGESVAALPLVGALLERLRGAHVLVTTGTVTSARIMAGRLPARAIHQYVPMDRMPWVTAFLDHWRPGLAVWIESELWPNLIRATAGRGAPMALVNGRMSARSYRGWRRWPGLARAVLSPFDPCLVQTADDATRFAALGARNVEAVGNLKYAAEPLPCDAAAREALRGALGHRPVWLAASTHPGEDEAVAAAHRALRAELPGLLTILAPRHATRGPAVAEALRRGGLAVSLRSEGTLPGRDDDVYLADTMGELGLLYRIAPVAFVGGSLVEHGGQNVLEPAQLGCAVVHGPHMANFAAIAGAMAEAGAAERVADAAALGPAVLALLGDEDRRSRMAEAARAVAQAERDVLPRTMAALEPHLASLADTAARADARA